MRYPNRRSIVLLSAVFSCLICTPLAHGQFGRGGMGGMGGGGQAPQPQAKKRYVPPQFAPTGPRINVLEVVLKGRFSVPESRVRATLQTRAGRAFDPQTVTTDVRNLITSGMCMDVNTYQDKRPNGVVITFELFERPVIRHIKFSGGTVRERTLLKKAEIKVGQPLSRYRVQEAKRKLEEYYRSRGNSHIEIQVTEGEGPQDRGVTFQITEGPRQRIRWTSFEGNTVASDARLRTQIDSKPGPLWLFKGQVDNDQIDEDVDKLTSYYRSLGYFLARITKDLRFDKDEEWATLVFHIDEGPRYVIRNVTVEGNEVYPVEQLLATTELRSGEHFDLARMNSDVRMLKDIYGANGYIRADVIANPRFYEEPGQLDLVYSIKEGSQYRVGEIKVNIDGEHPHTRQAVVLNRVDFRAGDIIDSRKLRASERRLRSSQLFEANALNAPEINVIPRDDAVQVARPLSQNQFR